MVSTSRHAGPYACESTQRIPRHLLDAPAKAVDLLVGGFVLYGQVARALLIGQMIESSLRTASMLFLLPGERTSILSA